jgi:hypothetical protein
MENNTFLLVTCWLPVGYISDEELRQLGDFLFMQERKFHARIALIQIKCLFVPCARHKYHLDFYLEDKQVYLHANFLSKLLLRLFASRSN